jgi:hypothetical protein
MSGAIGSATLAALLCMFVPPDAAGRQDAPPRLELREVNGVSKFFDRTSGREFVPLGMNYIRLDTLRKQTDGTYFPYHSTLNRGVYDRARAEKALREMASDGYNTVRIFINCATDGGLLDPGKPIDQEYIANFADFLRLARANRMLVMPTMDWIPVPAPPEEKRRLWCPDFQCTSVHILTPEGVRANREFLVAMFRELKKAGAPMDAFFGYELRNELTFEADLAPLSIDSGRVTTANEKTYDLADTTQKRAMLDEGVVFWVDEMRKAIRGEVPGMLVGVGLVAPQEPHPIRVGDGRVSVSRPLIERSSLDFIDVHVYLEPNGMTLKEHAENLGISKATRKAVVMGEFGGTLLMYTNVDVTAREMLELQKRASDFGIEGWLFWSWDKDVARDTWAAADSGGVIRRAIAPAGKQTLEPIPARRAHLPTKVRASASYQDMVPDLVRDGTMRQWNSGDFPPQWIEVAPERPDKIAEIRLVVAQTPDGPTTHELWLKPVNGDYRKVTTFEGETKNYQRLVYNLKEPLVVEFVKIVTVKSPSWVAWREIELAPRPTD